MILLSQVRLGQPIFNKGQFILFIHTFSLYHTYIIRCCTYTLFPELHLHFIDVTIRHTDDAAQQKKQTNKQTKTLKNIIGIRRLIYFDHKRERGNTAKTFYFFIVVIIDRVFRETCRYIIYLPCLQNIEEQQTFIRVICLFPYILYRKRGESTSSVPSGLQYTILSYYIADDRELLCASSLKIKSFSFSHDCWGAVITIISISLYNNHLRK